MGSKQSIVNGPQSMVHSPQSIVNGQWSIAEGKQSTVHSRQSMVNGSKFKVQGSKLIVDCGLWTVDRGLMILFCALSIFTTSCIEKKEEKLPIFGEKMIEGSDTVYHTIGDFKFVDQDSAFITNATFDNKIYVADFFFTSCRTICPIMKTQMKRIYDSIQNDTDVLLLSHSIDPEYDTVALLHDFAQRLDVKSLKWHFVTGVKDSIYKIAQTGYFATAMEDKSEPDGFIHSGAFLLIDKHRRIRGKYDGTKEEDVNRLLADIKRLEKEYAK